MFVLFGLSETGFASTRKINTITNTNTPPPIEPFKLKNKNLSLSPPFLPGNFGV